MPLAAAPVEPLALENSALPPDDDAATAGECGAVLAALLPNAAVLEFATSIVFFTRRRPPVVLIRSVDEEADIVERKSER